MPLERGRSRAAIERNLAELKSVGYEKRQALAIALKTAGIAPRKGSKTMAKKRKSPKRVAAGKKAARTRKRNKAKRRAARKK